MTLDAFLIAHPEFSQVNPTLIDATLAQATRRADPRVFGAVTDDYIGWLTAKLLAESPEGLGTRLEPGVTSVYAQQCDLLIQEAGAGIAIVAGAAPLLPGRFGCR